MKLKLYDWVSRIHLCRSKPHQARPRPSIIGWNVLHIEPRIFPPMNHCLKTGNRLSVFSRFPEFTVFVCRDWTALRLGWPWHNSYTMAVPGKKPLLLSHLISSQVYWYLNMSLQDGLMVFRFLGFEQGNHILFLLSVVAGATSQGAKCR